MFRKIFIHIQENEICWEIGNLLNQNTTDSTDKVPIFQYSWVDLQDFGKNNLKDFRNAKKSIE